MKDPFKETRDRCKFQMVPAKTYIPYPGNDQLHLWGNHSGQQHVQMGLFYELLTTAIFGGKLIDSIKESASEVCFGSNKPDVVKEKDRVVYESKANVLGHQFNIHANQFNTYCKMQILYPKYRVYYCIYRHSLRKIRKYQGTRVDLFRELSCATRALLVIPLSLLYSMFTHPLFQYYKNESWGECRRIPSTFTNDLIHNPAPCIDKLDSSKNYHNELLLSPCNLHIDGNQIETFPVRMIHHLEYQKFINLLDQPPF